MGRECSRCVARAAAASARILERDAKRDEVARAVSPVTPRRPSPRRTSPKSFTQRSRRNSGVWSGGDEEEDYKKTPPPCPLHHPHPASYSRCNNVGMSCMHTGTSNGLNNTHTTTNSHTHTLTATSRSEGGGSAQHTLDENATEGNGGVSTVGGTTSQAEHQLAARLRRENARHHTCARCTCPGFVDANGKRNDKDDEPRRSPFKRKSVADHTRHNGRRQSPRDVEKVDSWRRDVHQSGFDKDGHKLPSINDNRRNSRRHLRGGGSSSSGGSDSGDPSSRGGRHCTTNRSHRSRSQGGDDASSGRRRRSQHHYPGGGLSARGSTWNNSTFVPKTPQHAQRRSVHRMPRKPSSKGTGGAAVGGRRRRIRKGTNPNGSDGSGSFCSGSETDDGSNTTRTTARSEINSEILRQSALLKAELSKHALQQSEWADEIQHSKSRAEQNKAKVDYYLSMIGAVEAKLTSLENDHADELAPILSEYENKKRNCQEKIDLRIRALKETEEARATQAQCISDVENLRQDIENARADRVLNFIPRFPNTDGLIVSSADIGRTTTWEQDQQLAEFNDIAAAKTSEAMLRQRALRRQNDRENQLNQLQTLMMAKGGGLGNVSLDSNPANRPVQVYRTCEATAIPDIAGGDSAVTLLQNTTGFGAVPPSLTSLPSAIQQYHVPEELLAPYIPLLSYAVNATSTI